MAPGPRDERFLFTGFCGSLLAVPAPIAYLAPFQPPWSSAQGWPFNLQPWTDTTMDGHTTCINDAWPATSVFRTARCSPLRKAAGGQL